MRRQKPLSLVAIRTHRALMLLMSCVASVMFVAYVFLMNHLSMQGYVLGVEAEKNLKLITSLDQIEAQVARIQTREFVAKSVGEDQMVASIGKNFMVVPNVMTAQRDLGKNRN